MVIRDFVGKRERVSLCGILGSILPISTFGIKTRSHTMRARPNMKMLACLGTYASRCRHTKWHSTNTVRLFNSLELEAQQAYSNRPAAKKKEEDRTRKNNRIKKRINTGKKVEDETGCHIYFLVFPTLLQAFSRFLR